VDIWRERAFGDNPAFAAMFHNNVQWGCRYSRQPRPGRDLARNAIWPIGFMVSPETEDAMSDEQAASEWKEFAGMVKQEWSELTDEDLTVIKGKADELAGVIQQRYGVDREEAERQIDSFKRRNRDTPLI
jgi:uncharacterized protein YjbJ (UPF0337 family)